jgi:hypothetical protein
MNRVAYALVISLGLSSIAMLSSCGGSSTQQPVLSISVATLPDGTVGRSYNQTISVVNGTGPFQWSVSSGSLPDQLSLGNSTSNSDIVSGVPDIKQAAVKFTIGVSDSKGHRASESYTVNINNPPAPAIDISSLPPAGTVTVSYSSTFTATGGLAPLVWSETGALPTGLILAHNGTLSGRPTAAGSFPISVTVTDKVGQTDTESLTIVTNPSGISNARLNGHYAFVFQGFTPSNNTFDLAGSFVADGAGGLNSGHIDRNGVGESPVSDTTFSGTYSFDATDQGTIEIKNTAAGLDTIFRFVAMGPAASPATSATFIEYDNLGYGTGTALEQDPTAFSNSGIANDYIFRLWGTTASGGHAAAAGRFKANGGGGTSSAVMDVNQVGAVSSNTAFTLKYSVPMGSTSGRGTASLKTTLGGSPITLNFAIYIVSATEAFLIGSDPVTDSVPLYSGVTAQQMGAPFSKASMNGVFVYTTQGAVNSGANAGLADSSAGLISLDGAGNFSVSGDENMASAISQPNFSGNYDIDTNGRVTLTGGVTPPVIYLSRDVGFIVGTDDSASGGTFQKQSQDAVEKTTLDGTVSYFSTIGVVSLWNITSETAFSGGTYNGYWDVGIAYFFPKTYIRFTGNYTIAANGRGIANADVEYPEAFYIVGKNTFVRISSISPDDKFPGLVIGTCEQTSTAGFGSCP